VHRTKSFKLADLPENLIRFQSVPQNASFQDLGCCCLSLPDYLIRNRNGPPIFVTIAFGDDGIEITDQAGEFQRIAFQWLKILEDRGGSLVIGRKWLPGFRLHLSGETARMAREALKPAGWMKRAGRWVLGSPKAAVVILAMPFFVLDSLPGTWIARAVPSPLSKGIESTAINQTANKACKNAEGDAALRSMISAFATDAGPARAIVVNNGGFRVSARPGGEVLIDRAATTEVDAEVLAALIAHAMAHQHAGDVGIAVGRAEESNYLSRLTFFRFSRDLVELEYTREEEAAADLNAIAMMQRAGITLKPAAKFFAQMHEARLEERYWAQDYAQEHPGLRNRVATWTAAAAFQRTSHLALVEQQADALFNICWERPENAPVKWSEGRTS
jgi:hypothetical protein